MKIIAPFAATKNVGFQLYVSNMPKLSYLCLILHRNPSLAELLKEEIKSYT